MNIEEVLKEIREEARGEPDGGHWMLGWADAIEAAMREPVITWHSDGGWWLEWHKDKFSLPPGTKLFALTPDAAGEIERLKELLGDASKALDLAQALLERSAHHARILGAYERTRAALNTEAPK